MQEQVAEVQTSVWTSNTSEGWVFILKEDQIFHIGPRSAWIRVLSVYKKTNIAIVNYSSSSSGGDQSWILTAV